MSKGYIYIMANPALKDMVKIGFATNVEQRSQQLSTTALPYDYEIYATYETSGKLEDKKLHKLIDKLNPDLRVSKNREFFIMSPEDAYDLLETISIISNTTDKLKRNLDKQINKQVLRKPSINFYECGLKNGDELIYVEDPSIKADVYNEHKVIYNDEITSLTSIVKSIKNVKTINGPAYFSSKGEPLIELCNRTQRKDFK